MTFNRRMKVWGILLALALFLLVPALRASADEISASTRDRLTQVVTLRRDGKTTDAMKVLDDALRDARQDRVSTSAVEYVQGDTLMHAPAANADEKQKNENRAWGIYQRLTMVNLPTPVAIPGYAVPVDIQHEALLLLDGRNRNMTLYKVMSGIAGVVAHNPITGGLLAGHAGVLAILLLTVAIKLLLTPLTMKSFRSMREMQKLQPLMKELQQKYKDKPQELNKRMMELYQEHGVNPLSGCLPMLLQMPIIILLWRGIGLYQYPLSRESFLWVHSLAAADMPLAVIYAGSLYLSSKLTVVPTADPAQEQQQKLMATMMPLMFFFLFRTYPAGFILGWLFFNLLTTAQQYQMLRGHADEGPAAAAGSGPSNGGGGIGPKRIIDSGSGGAGPRRLAGPAQRAGKAQASQSARTIKRKRRMG